MESQRGTNGGNNRAEGPVIVLPPPGHPDSSPPLAQRDVPSGFYPLGAPVFATKRRRFDSSGSRGEQIEAQKTHSTTHTTGATEKKPRTKVVAGLILQAVRTTGFEPVIPGTPCNFLEGLATTPSNTHARFWASVSQQQARRSTVSRERLTAELTAHDPLSATQGVASDIGEQSGLGVRASMPGNDHSLCA
jgi:hypothetical protein